MSVSQGLDVIEGGNRTLIIARRAPAVPKTALIGGMVEISFARLRASIAVFNKGRTRSRPFDFEYFGTIADDVGSSCGKLMRCVDMSNSENAKTTMIGAGGCLCHD